ncbi:MAG: succinyl-diaminopimelate desuccinylase [Cellvibrionales bacterium TMED122]|nr:succinyl-diaminopimelate desuccinylase [Halieaceae bacterium]OUV63706.1 MAG: succinyl-diaminopimelate desuccinylase [Cellvibrionales bacterium TMED122]
MPITDPDDATLALTRELIARQSVTPDDAGCQDAMVSRLKQAGFSVDAMRFGEVDNFWATHGTSGPLLVFAGHTDVVPPGDEASWDSNPFEATVIGDELFGRGAADMKASLAAMVVACEQFIEQHPDHAGRIGFLITSDEEGPAKNGTVKVMDSLSSWGKQIDWCVVGEPSSTTVLGDLVKNGRRGSLNARLIVNGTQGHIAYPHLADNPIHHAMPALDSLAKEPWDNGNDFFDPTSLQISTIRAGQGVTNVIPGSLEVLFNLRFSTELTAEAIKSRCEDILKAHGLSYDIEWSLSGEPFLTEPGALLDAVMQSIEAVAGCRPQVSTGGGTSDGRFIAPSGAQVVEVGHVNATIHQCNERVKLADIPKLTEIYKGILERLLA